MSGWSCLIYLRNALNFITKEMDEGTHVDICFLEFGMTFDLHNQNILAALESLNTWLPG